ncbi:MAG: class I SAM-dependent methyltransferase [Armatimonadetes bacterium]|nr:class I SAM-dependent methyltransferase [Armatimonadota bacterium]
MKLRDSGMPEEAFWETLLRPAEALDRLGLDHIAGDSVEFGCGYGTFSLPLARRVAGTLGTYDIDPAMVERVRERAAAAGLANVRPAARDLFEDGTGLAGGSAGLVLIFNLLHCEEPERLLGEARRILEPGGVLAVSHWRSDVATPRGPSLDIRPRPEQLLAWAEAAGFVAATDEPVLLPPYHVGWRLARPVA